MTYPITYPAANSLIRRKPNSIVLAISTASSIEAEYTIIVRMKINPPFTLAGMLFLPNIGFIKTNPDIRIRISENKVSCAVLSIDMSSLLVSALYHSENFRGKLLQQLQHRTAGKYKYDTYYQ